MTGTEPTEPPAPSEAGAGAEAAEESAYATLLEDAFIAERGTPFLLSPKDWLLIRDWRARGIPVDTVIRAVRETFERRRSRGAAGKISSIAYCANAVDERWELERRGLVGRGDAQRTVEPEGVAPRLQRLVEALGGSAGRVPESFADEAFRKAVTAARDAAQALDPAGGFDVLEHELTKIERSLAKKLDKALFEPARAELEGRVNEALGDPAGLASEVVERTRRALRRRELRRMASLPALTLFDL